MTLFDLAQRFIGEVAERPAAADHPWIQWALSLCGFGFDAHDEVAWCSAAVNEWAWELRLPRSKSAAARSWLAIGKPVALADATIDNCVVVLKRGGQDQPGPEVLHAQGHVGVFAGFDRGDVQVIGGNQSNGVSMARFPIAQILGIRRLT